MTGWVCGSGRCLAPNRVSMVTKNTGVRNRPNNVTPDHAGKHRDSHRMAHFASSPVRQDQRHDAHDERERGHQDRPQAQPASLDSRLNDPHAVVIAFARKLDDQNRVLARQADEDDESYLREDVVVGAAQLHADHGRQQAHGHDENDGQRQ